MSDYSVLVGNRIRSYRKQIDYTLDEFAERIHKSKSTLSKYENGTVLMDLDTLYEICQELHISVSQLLEEKAGTEIRTSLSQPMGFFKDTGNYYMYHLQDERKIVRSVLQISSEATSEGNLKVAWYDGISDLVDLHIARYFYRGECYYSGMHINFIFYNFSNPVEKAFILVHNTLRNTDETTGIITGVSGEGFMPVSFKALFSKHLIHDESYLLTSLHPTKNEQLIFKKKHSLLLSSSD